MLAHFNSYSIANSEFIAWQRNLMETCPCQMQFQTFFPFFPLFFPGRNFGGFQINLRAACPTKEGKAYFSTGSTSDDSSKQGLLHIKKSKLIARKDDIVEIEY